MIKVIIGAIIVGIIAIGAFMIIDPNLKTTTVDQTVEVGSNTFQASIEGEIFKSGTYTLSEGATMDDLIQAAGGVSNNADELAYFASAPIVKGQSYFIASKYNVDDICSNQPIEKVNINTDSSEQLMAINGITSSIASSIVSYRIENGTFNTIEDLLEVYGIGNATYRKVRNFVTLHEWKFYSFLLRYFLDYRLVTILYYILY